MSKESKKAAWRPNIFDAVIVLIGAAVMALIVLVLRPAAANVNMTGDQEYTIELINLPEGTWEMIHPGDKLIDNVKKQALGEVVSVEALPYTSSMAKADGTAVVDSVVPGYERILVTVRSDMTVTDKAVTTAGGFTLRVGVDVAVKGPSYAASGYVVAIERGEE